MAYKLATKNLNNNKVESNSASQEFVQQNRSTSKLETLQRKADASQKVAQLDAQENRANSSGIKDQSKFEKAQGIVDGHEASIKDDQGKWVANPERDHIPAVEEFMDSDFINQHIDKFNEKGAAKFDNPENFANIGNNWHFGKDLGQFMGTLDEQRKIAKEAETESNHGLWHISKKLAVEPGAFIDKEILEEQGKIDGNKYEGGIDNKKSEIILAEIENPKKLAENIGEENILKMPSGKEGGALKGKFKFGGQTEGGLDEAVLAPITKEQFNQELSKTIRVKKFTYPNTSVSSTDEAIDATERDITFKTKDTNAKKNSANNP